MFDVGFSELVLLFVIGLLVLGPQRLPKVAAEIGKWVGRARRTATQLRRQLEREIELSDLQPPQPPVQPKSPPAASSPPPADVAPEAPASVTPEQPQPEVTPEQTPPPAAGDVPQSPPDPADKPPHV
jgi:sec-independent protein translocase protein TatB